MKAKQIVSLAIVLFVALLLVLLFQGVRSRSVTKTGSETLANRIYDSFPVNSVVQIGIETQEGTLHLERKEGVWTVRERDSYPADFGRVARFLKAMFELSAIQRIEVGPSKFNRVGLLEPSAEEVDDEERAMIVTFATEGGAKAPALWIGKEYKKAEQSQFGSFDSTAGRYVKLDDSDKVFLVAEELADAEIDPASWISKDFFAVRQVKSIERILKEQPDAGWKLTRESDTGDFTLVDATEGEELDSAAVGSMKNAFSSPSFEDVLMGDDAVVPDQVVFKVETFGGFSYEVFLSEKDEANEYRLAVKVAATLPEARDAVEGESEEEKKARDEEFATEQKELKDKLAREQALEGHVYRVRSFVADSINKDRSAVLKGAETGETGEATGMPSIPGLGGGLPGIGN